jgi:hypothetical protein
MNVSCLHNCGDRGFCERIDNITQCVCETLWTGDQCTIPWDNNTAFLVLWICYRIMEIVLQFVCLAVAANQLCIHERSIGDRTIISLSSGS